MAKDAKKTSKGGKGAKVTGSSETDPAIIRLWTSRGRAWGSLVGFFVVTLVSYRAGMGLTDAAFRGLIGGVAFSFVGWGCALLVLTGLLRTAAHTLVDEERKAAEAAAAARAEAIAQTASARHPADRRFDPPAAAGTSDFAPESAAGA